MGGELFLMRCPKVLRDGQSPFWERVRTSLATRGTQAGAGSPFGAGVDLELGLAGFLVAGIGVACPLVDLATDLADAPALLGVAGLGFR